MQRGAAALAFAQLAPAEVWIGLAKAALFGATLAGVACAIGLLAASRAPTTSRGWLRAARVAAMLAVAALDLLLVASRLS